MNKIDISRKIIELAREHSSVGHDLEDIKYSDLLESQAIRLIVGYCEEMGYQVNGFPHEKRKLAATDENFDRDYFSQERFELYLDTLAISKDDVADLCWGYVSSFWPDEFENKELYLLILKENINSGVFYNVSLD